MQDTSVAARQVEYHRYSSNSTAPREERVRVYHGSPERVTLQLRNAKHYMTAALDVEQTKSVIAALSAGLTEIEDRGA